MKNTEAIEALLMDAQKYGAGPQQGMAEKALEEWRFIRESAAKAVARGEPEGGKYADIWAFLESIAKDAP